MKTDAGKRYGLRTLVVLFALLLSTIAWLREPAPVRWSAQELAVLETLSLSRLPPLPPAPGNAVADNPDAAALGQALFFDSRLSVSNSFSCASCHRPELRFSDGLAQARALGTADRNTPSIVGAAFSPWLYWDGRKDSLWAQALSPLEHPEEQGSNRMRLVRLLAGDRDYRSRYEALFGALPEFDDPARFPVDAAPVAAEPAWVGAWHRMGEADRILVNTAFANLGKALAAYERQLLPGRSRFDDYVDALVAGNSAVPEAGLLSETERRGLKLFIGEARCLECHNGPLLTNNEFHNTGLLPPPGQVPDQGRSRVLQQLRQDPFNCLGPYSDAPAEQCRELRYMRQGPELIGAMRTPSLRNLGGTAPYMHKGQIPDLRGVLEHYNAPGLALIGHNEAEPLGLSSRELEELEAFLRTLDAPVAGKPSLLQAPPGHQPQGRHH